MTIEQLLHDYESTAAPRRAEIARLTKEASKARNELRDRLHVLASEITGYPWYDIGKTSVPVLFTSARLRGEIRRVGGRWRLICGLLGTHQFYPTIEAALLAWKERAGV